MKIKKERFKNNKLREYIKIFNIQLIFREDLIYYQNKYNNRERLCILKNLKRKFFELIYDKHNYEKFHRIYERIVKLYYFKHLIKRFECYILYCFKC